MLCIGGKKRNTSAFTSPSTWKEVYPSSHFWEVKVPFGATEGTKMSLKKKSYIKRCSSESYCFY